MKKFLSLVVALAFGLGATAAFAADAPKDASKDGAKKEAPKKKKESC